MIVHQLLSGAGPHDAITNEALAFRACFARWGWGGQDFAARIAPGLGGRIESVHRLRAEPDDVLLLHHSAHFPQLDGLLALSSRKLLLYHNITPPEWLWAAAPVVAAHCEIGRTQLPRIVAAVDAAAADSAFNASELVTLGARDPIVVPLLVDPDRLGAAAPAAPADPRVLFVGRLSPHKRQDEVIRAFALLRAHRMPQARLTLVGDPLTAAYAESLHRLGEELAPGAVTIESGLSDAELGERYRSAGAFLCLSAHEGFCVPVLEAFRLGVPVIARPAGAVAELAEGAALTVEDHDPAVLAEVLALVLGDAELRGELIRRGHERAGDFTPTRVQERLRAAVQAAAAGGGAGSG